MNFSFDPASHSYSIDGKQVPGVTRVLDMAGICDYSAIRADVLERKSELGKEVHKACHFVDEDDIRWESVSEEISGYVAAWQTFTALECFEPYPDRIEFQTVATVNGMAYGMRVDRAGLMRGRPAIVEIKTTAQIMRAHAIQLAGYALGLPHANEPPNLNGSLARFFGWERYVVQLKADGTFRLRQFKDPNDAPIFTAGLAITTWKMNNGQKIGEIEE